MVSVTRPAVPDLATEADHGGTDGERFVGDQDMARIALVVLEHEVAVAHEQHRATARGPVADEHPLVGGPVPVDRHGHLVGTVGREGDVDRGDAGDARTQDELVHLAGRSGRAQQAEPLDHAVVEGEHAELAGGGPPALDQIGEPVGLVRRSVVPLGPVLVEVVELPDVVVVGAAEGVEGDGLPAVVDHGAVPAHLEVLGAVAGSVGLRKVEAMLVPCSGIWATPRRMAGASMPASSRMVGVTSIAWWNWWRSPPGSSMPAGQCTMNGTRTPPPWVLPLYRLSGVFEAWAQPCG
jgi:hypothetical protein